MELTEIKAIMKQYGIDIDKVTREIDTSRSNDYRLNLILDRKYVLRINNTGVITEKRLEEIERLICRYNEIGVYAPHLVRNSNGTFSTSYQDKICYVTEYADYPLAEERENESAAEQENEDNSELRKEIALMLGRFASKYTDRDLSEITSMWSIIDLAPLDIDRDEKQENLDRLVAKLKEAGEAELADRVNEFNENNRAEIKKVFRQLPRCVYQGDLNSSNILLKEDKFFGLIDFNLSGTEVNINCFLAETNWYLTDEQVQRYTVEELYDKMIKNQDELMNLVFINYTMNDIEKQVYENYRNIMLISQWPNMLVFNHNLMEPTLKNKILSLICKIITR